MGQLILPNVVSSCLDADAVIYAIEKIQPYDSFSCPY